VAHQVSKKAGTMNLNADFTKRAVVHAATLDWKASPMLGVERRMLDRMGDEVARAAVMAAAAHRGAFQPVRRFRRLSRLDQRGPPPSRPGSAAHGGGGGVAGCLVK
jgi:hypothetical protein